MAVISRAFRTVGLLAAVGLGLSVLAACDDDPFAVDWRENRQERTIYTLDHPQDVRTTAFDLFNRRGVRIDGPDTEGRWDFAVEREGERFFLVPPGALGVDSGAGIVRVPEIEWDDVREAPRDTAAYVTRDRVEVATTDIYIIRTHEQPGAFGRRCVYFGKVRPLSTDVERLQLTFEFDVSPRCNDRNLVPTIQDS